MRVEKQVTQSGGGRYIGGFRNLFDWNSKSRKRFFPKKSDFSEQSEQKKENDENKPMTTFQMTGGCSCTSSVTEEDSYGAKAPGVVARLMGLDTLPVSNVHDTYSNRSSDSQSLQGSSVPYITNKLQLEQTESLPPMTHTKMIAKFQTETLPPKAAKSIPITQNNLLSPIKSPEFFSYRNPSYIMEATSKIPRPSSSSSSSSVKVRNQKQKTENCTRKPSKISRNEQNAAKNLKASSKAKPLRILEDKDSSKKPVSLALQAKANVQKREGLRLYGADNGSLTVLKQNNQKQNGLVDKGKTTPNSSAKSTSRRKSCVEDEKNGMGIVSFTFSRSMPNRVVEKTEFFADNKRCESSKSATSLNCNALKTGSLSTFLEQKLRELSCDSDFDSQELLSIFQDRMKEPSSRFSSNDPQLDLSNVGSEVTSKLKSNHSEYRKFLNAQNPSLILALESSTHSNNIVGCKKELFDTKPLDSAESEPVYIKKVLSHIESMFEEFTIGRTQKLINPCLFDRLEAQRPVFEKQKKLTFRRKLVFDFVIESIDSRCRVWDRGLVAVRRKDRLAEDVYKEMLKCETMKDCACDELVDKDMSCDLFGKWLDFDAEKFELGVEIERRLFCSLIDEAFSDLLVV